MSVRKSILKLAFSSLVIRLLSVLASLLSTVVLARVLGPGEYGLYSFAFAILTILAIPVQAGLPTLVLRITAQANTFANWQELLGVWTWATRVILGGTFVVIAIILVLMAVAGDQLGDEKRLVLLVGLPLVPLVAASKVRSAALRGLKHIWAAGFPEGIFRPLLLALLTLGVFSAGSKQEIDAVMALSLAVIAATTAFGLGSLLAWRKRPSEMVTVTRGKLNHREWIRSLWPLSLISGLQIVMQNTDLLMLGLMRDSEEVGQYRISLSLASLAVFALTAINFVIQPYFAEAHARGDRQLLQRLAGASALVAFAATATLLPAVWFAGEWGLTLIFGTAYLAAFVPLIILMLGQGVSAYFGSVGNLLTMGGHERRNLRAAAVATAVNILLNGAFIPRYGPIGAAVATASSIAVLNFLMWMEARWLLKIDSSPFGFFKKVV